jgi:hypothetical protein
MANNGVDVTTGVQHPVGDEGRATEELVAVEGSDDAVPSHASSSRLEVLTGPSLPPDFPRSKDLTPDDSQEQLNMQRSKQRALFQPKLGPIIGSSNYGSSVKPSQEEHSQDSAEAQKIAMRATRELAIIRRQREEAEGKHLDEEKRHDEKIIRLLAYSFMGLPRGASPLPIRLDPIHPHLKRSGNLMMLSWEDRSDPLCILVLCPIISRK